ncbi:2723_t:CDS:2, partial [Acaulospora colombiana]
TPKQTTVEKKPNSAKKIARLVKKNPADLKPISLQMQQLQACGPQDLTRMDAPSSSSWSNSFKKETDLVKNNTDLTDSDTEI